MLSIEFPEISSDDWFNLWQHFSPMSGKEDNIMQYTQIFGNFLSGISVPFILIFQLKFLKILSWKFALSKFNNFRIFQKRFHWISVPFVSVSKLMVIIYVILTCKILCNKLCSSLLQYTELYFCDLPFTMKYMKCGFWLQYWPVHSFLFLHSCDFHNRTTGYKLRASTKIQKLCYLGSDDRSVRLWDLNTGQCKYVLKAHTCADICFDDHKVITASFDNTVGMWDWNTGENLQYFRGHTAAGKENMVAMYSYFEKDCPRRA